MFITFEGIDGCGKTTQIKLLSEYLKLKNFEVVNIREPGGTAANEKIRRILLENNEFISPVSELFLFEAARNNLINTIIKPALSDNKIVISDRFFDSTTAYQGYGRGLDINMINSINDIAIESIYPDITFFLDINIEEATKRGLHKNKDRIEAAGDEFFEKVRDGYKTISNLNPERIIVIDSSKELVLTHQEIIMHVENKINKLLLSKSKEVS
jgi:dTMP kinase